MYEKEQFKQQGLIRNSSFQQIQFSKSIDQSAILSLQNHNIQSALDKNPLMETIAFTSPELNLSEKRKQQNQSIVLSNLTRILAMKKDQIPISVFNSYDRALSFTQKTIFGFNLSFLAMGGYCLIAKNKNWYKVTTNIKTTWLRLSILFLTPNFINHQFGKFELRFVVRNKDFLEPVFQDYTRTLHTYSELVDLIKKPKPSKPQE